MIFKRYTITNFFFGEKSRIYESKATEITFDNLTEKGKLKALELGFSPAISLIVKNHYDWQIISGETVCPIFFICPEEDFLTY